MKREAEYATRSDRLCMKCGDDVPYIRYDPEGDILACTCRVCGYKFDILPKDRGDDFRKYFADVLARRPS